MSRNRVSPLRAAGLIYHAFDTESGKCWIGQTWMTLEERKYFHSQKSSSCTVFRNALLKRPKAFVWSVLVSEIRTQEELDAAENHFIAFFDSLVPNGFNLKMGGSRGRNSSELNEKISRGMMGKNTWSAGRKQSPESMRRRIETMKSRGHTNKGRKMTEDTRAKMRAGWQARRDRLNEK